MIIVCDSYCDWSASGLVCWMEISYTLLLISHCKYEEARKQKWHGGRGEWHRNILVLQHKLFHIKRGLLSSHKKGNSEFYKLIRVCEPSPAKPGAVPKSCYRQRSWGKRAAWRVPHGRGQGCDVGRRYIQSQQPAVAAATTYEECWHGAQQHLTREEEKEDSGQSADIVWRYRSGSMK